MKVMWSLTLLEKKMVYAPTAYTANWFSTRLSTLCITITTIFSIVGFFVFKLFGYPEKVKPMGYGLRCYLNAVGSKPDKYTVIGHFDLEL